MDGVTTRPALSAALAMVCVGSSVAVSTTIVDAPLFTLQALRYGVAAVLMLAVGALTGRALPRPRGREWLWLVAVAGLGLVLFNVAVVRGVAHAEPAVIGVAVAAVPLALAIGGPLAAGRRPAPVTLAGAAIVTVGAVLVQGGGRTDLAGIGWAVLVLACEVGFTLCAVPVLARLGPWGVTLHAVGIAAVGLTALGLAVEGPVALDGGDLLAAAHLAVVVTVVAFLLWYSAVGRLGAARAGLFTGVAPVAAAAGGVLLGGAVPAPGVWLGVAVVGLGVAVGMRAPEAASASPTALRGTSAP